MCGVFRSRVAAFVSASALALLFANIATAQTVLPAGQTTFNISGTNNYFTQFTGVGGIDKTGVGTMVFNYNGVPATNYSGPTNIQAGTIKAGAAGTLSLNSAFVLSGSTVLNLNNFNNEIGSLAGAGTVHLGSGTLTNGGDGTSTIFLGNIDGTGGLAKAGAGTLTLVGTSSYSGATLVSAGTLAALGNSAFSSSSAFTVNGGATLDISGANNSLGSLAGSGSVSLGNAYLTVGSDNSSTLFDGDITGGGKLFKTGTGTLTLSGNSNFSGGTTISGGTLSLGSDNAAGTGDITTTGSIIDYADTVVIGNTIIVSSDHTQLQVTNVLATAEQSGDITDDGNARPIEKIGLGTLILSGFNDYGGDTKVTAGTLVLANGNSSVATSNYFVNSGATLSLGTFADFDVNSLNNGIGGGGIVDVGFGSRLFIGDSGLTSNTTFSGQFTGDGELTIEKAASLTLNGNVSHELGDVTLCSCSTGSLTLSAGSFTVDNQTKVEAGTLTVNNGAVWNTDDLFVAGGSTIVTGTGSQMNVNFFTGIGDPSATPSSLSILAGATMQSLDGMGIDGDVTGTAATVTVSGTGSSLTVSGSELEIGAFSNGTLTVADGASLTATDGLYIGTGFFTGTPGTLYIGTGGLGGSISAPLYFTNDGHIIANFTDTVTLSDAIDGAGSLTKSGGGTLILSGDDSFSGPITVSGGKLTLSGNNSFTGGITVAGGTLSLGSNNAAGGSGNFIVTTGSVIDYAAGVDNSTPININSNTTQLNVTTGIATQSGLISQTSGPRPLEKTGGGTLILSAANTFSGALTISGGTVQAGAESNLGAGNSIILNNGTLAWGAGYTIAGHSFTLSNAGTFQTNFTSGISTTISGSGSLTKTGSGTLTLTGTTAYTGGTFVNAGTLIVGDTTHQLFLLNNVTAAGGTLFFSNANNFFVNTITANTNGLVTFLNNTTAAFATVNVNQLGTVSFNNSSSAAFASITTDGTFVSLADYGGTLIFSNTSTAASSLINNNNNGVTLFNNTATAGGATIYNYNSGTVDPVGFYSGGTYFRGSSTAGTSLIVNYGNGLTGFTGTSTGGSSTIYNYDTSKTYFYGNSTGGNAAIINVDNTGIIDFSNSTGPLGDNKLSVGYIAGPGSIKLGNKQVSVGSRGVDSTFSGVISGTGGSLVKVGNDTLTLTGSNTYSGTTTINAGTLQIGNGGTGGSLAGGDVIDNASLIFNHSDNITFANLITGTGTLVQNGTGTTFLTNNNSYGGGTIINAGLLVLADGAFAPSTVGGDVLDNAFYGTYRSGTVTLTGVISGTGTFHVARPTGTTILTGTNTYAGDTVVEAGTLQLGAGGTSGSVTSNIVDNGALIFNRSDAVTFAGNISGSGSMTKLATNTLTLTGTNTYNGGTTISAGTLQIGNGGTSGALGGNIADNAAITFNRSDTLTYAGIISGSGTLAKQGSGNLILSGTSSFNGATSVNAGTLSVNGSISSSAVTVNSGGTLGGTGTAGSTTVTSGGALSPGNSGIGTLNVSGNLTLASGSTTGLEANNTTSDKILVSGTASVGGNLFVNFATGQTYLPTTYTIITSTGALSGTFASLNTLGIPVGFLATTTYNGNNAFVNLAYLPFIWSSAPATTDWNTAANWQNGLVPPAGQIAQFSATSGQTVVVSQTDSIASLKFNNTAPTYALNITGNSSNSASLTLTNGGITDDSTFAPNITVSGVSSTRTGTLAFTGTGNAADANIVAGNFGSVTFAGTTNAGSASRLTAQSGGTISLAGTTGAANDNNVSAGSISGAGSFVLGSNALTVGALNSSTEVSGVISGTNGALTKVGTGTLTLSGTNTYTGVTTVSAGTLRLGNGGAGGIVAGNIVNNATLAFNRSDNFTYAGVISGTGAVQQTGSGTTTLTGVNTYNGTTTITNGVLSVNGSIANSAVIVNGGALKGTGTIGSLTLGSGVLAPGNSIGTLNISGNVTFASGTTYQVETNAAGQSDLVNATGSATLAGSVQAQPIAGTYAPSTTYRILNAGSITGTFAGGVTSTISNLTPTLTYSANAVDLTLIRNDIVFGAAYGTTPNQIAVGGAISAGGVSTTLFQKLAIVANTPTAVPAALDSLSGEIHATVLTEALNRADQARVAMLSEARTSHNAASDNGISLWARITGAWNNARSDGNAAAMKGGMVDATVGVHLTLDPGIVAGLQGGFGTSTMQVPGRASRASLTNAHVGGYIGASLAPVDLRAGFIYGWGKTKTDRVITFTGVADHTNSAQDGNTLDWFGEISAPIISDEYKISPFFGVSWTQAHLDAFSEAGGITALSGNEVSPNQTTISFGADISKNVQLDDTLTLTPSLRLAWQKSLRNGPVGRNVTFIGTGQRFTVWGAPLDQDSFLVDGTLGFNLMSGLNARMGYNGSFSTNSVSHSITGTLSWSF